MPPVLIAIVLGAGLLALIPTRRVAERTGERWLVAAYWIGLWLLLVALVLAPPLRRIGIPLAIALAIGPWLVLPTGLGQLLGRPGRRQPPPRNVTPPEAGGPAAR